MAKFQCSWSSSCNIEKAKYYILNCSTFYFYFYPLCASATTHVIQVMSATKRDGGTASQDAIVAVINAQNGVVDYHLEKSQ